MKSMQTLFCLFIFCFKIVTRVSKVTRLEVNFSVTALCTCGHYTDVLDVQGSNEVCLQLS